MTKAPKASEKPQYTENTAIPRHRPMETTKSVSPLRKRRVRPNRDGRTYTPTKNHITRKNTNLATDISSASPSTALLTAMDDSITIITTAKRSSTMRTASTKEANFFCLIPKSLKALIMIVVDDMDNIPPRNRQLMVLKPMA